MSYMNRMVILFLVSKNRITNLIAVELNTNSTKLTMSTSDSFPSGGKNFPAAQMLPPDGYRSGLSNCQEAFSDLLQ